jgi:hypothetical protein
MPTASVAPETTMAICLCSVSSAAGTNIMIVTPTSGRNVPRVSRKLLLKSMVVALTSSRG